MFISITQIVVSVVLICLILIQERSSGLSGVFGGSEGEAYHVRRGFEKIVFYLTIILAIAVAGLSLLDIYLK
ncbi:preprotein translocase subunit SecG [Candidatus Wolfebacteria bacterium]|nr:preprotein translocase subunit SecG [Candidatus Wolfebacteria bacterium]